MNELRRSRIKCEIDIISTARDRIDKIRDDEERALRGDHSQEYGSQGAADLLTEASHILGVVSAILQKAKQCN